MARVSTQQAIEALRDSHGLVSVAAKKLGISRVTLHAMINKMPTVAEARNDAKEALKDFAESAIYQQIKDGNTTMIIFFAKTQMKDRGYIERQEVEHAGPGGGPIEFTQVEVQLDHNKSMED